MNNQTTTPTKTVKHMRMEAFIETAARLRREDRISQGQAMMETLLEWEPKLYQKVRGSEFDPILGNTRVYRFISFLFENMPEYSSACSHTGTTFPCASCRVRDGI